MQWLRGLQQNNMQFQTQMFPLHILIFLWMYSSITVVLGYVYEELVTYRFCIWQLWGFHSIDVETSGLLGCYTG